MTQPDSRSLMSPAAAPLTRPKHERFAQLVALGMPALQAAREAGYEWNGTPVGNAANARRLSQRRAIKARVAWWRGNQDADILAEKRKLIEERLWLWHQVDIGDFYEDVEEPILDDDRNPVLDDEGHSCMRIVQRLRPFS